MRRRARFHRIHFQIEPKHIFVVLAVVCALLIAATSVNAIIGGGIRGGLSTLLSPVQKGMNRFGSLVYGGIEGVKELSAVREENIRLKEEIGELREQNTRYQLRLRELDDYRELMNFKEQYPDFDTIGAHVISKNSGNWFSTFKIDRGSVDGIKENMNIIADGGLVGIVTSVEPFTSTVSSIIDDGRSVAAMAVTSQAPCIVTGNALLRQEGTIDLSHVNKDDDIDVASKIATSDTSSEYLPGILIGYVSELNTDSNNLTKSGKVIPAVDFTALDSVLVITTLKRTEG